MHESLDKVNGIFQNTKHIDRGRVQICALMVWNILALYSFLGQSDNIHGIVVHRTEHHKSKTSTKVTVNK